jgi:hypothetical protein
MLSPKDHIPLPTWLAGMFPLAGASLHNIISLLQGKPNHPIGKRGSPITRLVLRTCISSTHLLLLSVTGRITNSVRKQAASSAYSAWWEGQDASYSLGVGPSRTG